MKTGTDFAAILFLALLAAACSGDAPASPAAPTAPEPEPPPNNRAPVVANTLEAAVVVLGTAKAVDVEGYFTDPDGEGLSYASSSSDPALARVSVEGSLVTVVGMGEGTATVTVTASDDDGGTAQQGFAVTVVSLQGPWAWEGEVLVWQDGATGYREWREGRAVLNLAHRAGGAGVVVRGGLDVIITLCDPCGGAAPGRPVRASQPGTTTRFADTVTVADTVGITAKISSFFARRIHLVGEQEFGVAPAILAEHFYVNDLDFECNSEYTLALTDAGQLRVTGERGCGDGRLFGVDVTLSPSRTEVLSGLYAVHYRAGGSIGRTHLRLAHWGDHERVAVRLLDVPECAGRGGGGGGSVVPVPDGVLVGLSGFESPSYEVSGQLAFRSADRSLTVDPPALMECESEVVLFWTDGAEVPDGNPWAEWAEGLESDRAALVALYHATDGPNWTNNDNWLTDAPVREWYGVTGNLTGLKQLDLYNNDLSGPIPPEIGNLAALEYLYLGVNDLSGPIPPEIGNLAALEYLRLSHNDLSGPIPPEIGNLAALEYLNLYHNFHLSGPIPPEIGNLAALEYLYLGVNDLSGPIPPEIGNLAALEYLNLNQNRLSGPIPPEIGNLAALGVLVLSRNDLSGPIPPEMANLTALWQLVLSANQNPRENPGLCTPDDSRLLEWLAALNVQQHPRCEGGG